jgi:hypothetical protein
MTSSSDSGPVTRSARSENRWSTRRPISRCALFAALAGLGFGALAAQADTPEQAICAVEQAVACPAFEPCERTLPGAVNMPSLIKIDRPGGVVLSTSESGETRSSPIGSEVVGEGVHILHGDEDGHPWSLRIDLGSGRFTLVTARDDLGFVAFGVCTTALIGGGDGE